jgi:hypothetical protein
MPGNEIIKAVRAEKRKKLTISRRLDMIRALSDRRGRKMRDMAILIE